MTGGYPPSAGDAATPDPTSTAGADVAPPVPTGWPAPSAPPSPYAPAPAAPPQLAPPASVPPSPTAPGSAPPYFSYSPPAATPPYAAYPPYTAYPPASAPPGAVPPGPAPPAYPYGQPGYPFPSYPPAPPRGSRTGLIIGLVIAAVVVVLGGSAAVVIAVGRNRLQPVAGATPPGSTTKNVRPVGPEAYQKTLDSVDQELGPLYSAMVAAKHPDELQTTAFALAKAIRTRTDALGGLGPPAVVAAAHQRLIEGLNAFGSAVTSVGSTNLGTVCAGPSALSFVSRSVGADRLRDAVAQLATADTSHAYKVGAFVPPSTPDPNRSLSNGTTIKSSKSSQANRMVIKNPTTLDVVASVAPTGTKTALAIFYVKAGQDATYIGIPDGDYDLYFTHGQDWDTATTAFTRQCQYLEVPKTFDFTSTATTYSVWTITVQDDDPWAAPYTAFPL